MTLSEELRVLQASLGLPEQELYRTKLLYSAAARAIVLSCTVKVHKTYVGRLYVRKLGSDKYASLVTGVAPTHSFESPVVSQEPFLYSVEYEGGNFRQLLRIDLLSAVIDRREREDFEAGMFLAELAGTDAGGAIVYGVAGFRPESGLGRVRYYLVSIEWASGATERLTEFEGASF